MKSDEVIYGGANELLNKYIRAYGQDILLRRPVDPIPNGWVQIVIEMFWQIKSYHPGTKNASILIAPISRYGSGIFTVSMTTPPTNNLSRNPKLPRSLKWITEQARKKAYSTCAACGQPIGRLTARNLCSLCACKIGVRHFSE